MSKYELIDAYISQSINRRAFIKGLTALGVSSGVAASYAVALQPASAATCEFYDDPNNFYDFYDLYCNNSGGSQPDGSQGGSGSTDIGQGEEGNKKRRRRRKKGKNKKKH